MTRFALESGKTICSYLAGNLCPYELFCMVEAGLDQVWQVVMLSSTNEAWDGWEAMSDTLEEYNRPGIVMQESGQHPECR